MKWITLQLRVLAAVVEEQSYTRGAGGVHDSIGRQPARALARAGPGRAPGGAYGRQRYRHAGGRGAAALRQGDAPRRRRRRALRQLLTSGAGRAASSSASAGAPSTLSRRSSPASRLAAPEVESFLQVASAPTWKRPSPAHGGRGRDEWAGSSAGFRRRPSAPTGSSCRRRLPLSRRAALALMSLARVAGGADHRPRRGHRLMAPGLPLGGGAGGRPPPRSAPGQPRGHQEGRRGRPWGSVPLGLGGGARGDTRHAASRPSRHPPHPAASPTNWCAPGDQPTSPWPPCCASPRTTSNAAAHLPVDGLDGLLDGVDGPRRSIPSGTPPGAEGQAEAQAGVPARVA